MFSPMSAGFGSPYSAGMDVDVREEACEEDEMQAPHLLEEELADILGQLLSERFTAQQAVGSLEAMCQRRAQALRQEASGLLHRPARALHLQSLAQELEQQAATWHLVWCLHCGQLAPAGTGGAELRGVGGRRSSRQVLADAVSADPQLARCAAVVMWLESLADDALGSSSTAPPALYGPGGVPAGLPQFSDHEGVWLETRIRLGQGGLVSELDPDAPCRQGRSLQPDNAKAEERLLGRCWALVRAGRVKEARALCRSCGCPWRAASLGGPGGDWGLLPVGVAAARMEEEGTAVGQAEEVAVEVACGPASARQLWRWSCLQAARQAMACGPPGGRYEAALYGLQGGCLAALMPVCSSWEDGCWALCRCWLEAAGEEVLGEEALQRKAWLQQAQLQVSGEVVAEVLRRLAAATRGQAGGSRALAGGAEELMRGLMKLTGQQGQGGAQGGEEDSSMTGGVPRSLTQVFASLATSAAPGVAAAAEDKQRLVQQDLALGRLGRLAQRLFTWLTDPATAAEPPPPLAAPLFTPAPSPGPLGGGDSWGEAGDVLGLPARPLPRLSAFSAHLVLVLQALGVTAAAQAGRHAVYGGEGGGAAAQVEGLGEQVQGLYAAQLLERRRFHLVPLYLAPLRPPLRALLVQELLTALTQDLATAPAPPGLQADGPGGGEGGGGGLLQPGADAAAFRVLCALTHWAQLCSARQERGEPTTLLTHLRQEEVQGLLAGFVSSVRLGGQWGLAARTRAVRWLLYPWLLSALQREQQGGQGGAAEELAPRVFSDALEVVAALCCELALGNSRTCSQAHAMMHTVLPPCFEEAAADAAAGLRVQLGAVLVAGQAEQDRAEGSALEAEAGLDSAGSWPPAVGGELAALQAQAQALSAAAEGLEELGGEVAAWRSYLELDARLAAWSQRCEALQAAGSSVGGAAREAVEGEGRGLVEELLQLLQSGWMCPLLGPERAAAEQLCSITLTLAAALEGEDQEGGGGEEGGEGAALAFSPLKGAVLAEAEQRLGAALDSAVTRLNASPALAPLPTRQQAPNHAGRSSQRGEGPGNSAAALQAAVTAPPEGLGFLTVTLSCQQGHAAAWQAMVGLAVEVVGGSLLAQGAGSEAAPPPPALLLANMQAGRAASQEVCRRCCLSQAVQRVASLRYALTLLGCTADPGAELIELLATADMSRVAQGSSPQRDVAGLASVLSPTLLQTVLRLEADTLVAAMANAQRDGTRT